MTAQLNLQAVVSVEAKGASAELDRLSKRVAETKAELIESKAASRDAAAELKNLDRSAGNAADQAKILTDLLAVTARNEAAAGAAARSAANDLKALARSSSDYARDATGANASASKLGSSLGELVEKVTPAGAAASELGGTVSGVGDALSGMGGRVGDVGALLAGPFVAAAVGAGVALYNYIQEASGAAAATAAQEAATKAQIAAIEALDRATGRVNQTTEETIRLGIAAAQTSLKEAQADRAKLQVKLELARAEVAARLRQANDPASANEAGFNTGATLAGLAEGDARRISADLAQNAAAVTGLQEAINAGGFKTALIAATAATSAAAKANLEYERTETRLKAAVIAGSLSQRDAETQLVSAIKTRDAATSAARDAAKQATAAQREQSAAQREHNKELREAARDAAAAAREQKVFADTLEKGLSTIRNSSPAGGSKFIADAENARRASEDRTPRNDMLGSITSGIDAGRPVGKSAAEAFNAEALTGAIAIGQAIGGSAGRALSSVAGLLKGAKTGDFTGIGGPIGGLLTLAKGTKLGGGISQGIGQSIFGGEGQAEIGKLLKPLKPMGDAIGKVFGDGGKVFGKLIGGAATGSAVAGLANAVGIKLNETGAKIGGALGQFFGPLGSLVGSVLGGIIGNLFGKPKGSTTVSAVDGKISQSSTGDKAIQKATGQVGNSVTDALQAIADQLGASIGSFSVSIGQEGKKFRVDTTGSGSTKKNDSTVLGFGEDGGAALAAAISDALRDGAIKTSPRVQAALTAYGDNINKAVAEALKVKGLEDLLADRQNPFAGAFRNLETQLRLRVDVATRNGFDLVEIERINGEDRAKALKDTLANATAGVRNLLNDLQFGSRATGSPTERLAGLTAERDRLAGLVRGGDTSQLDAAANVVQQILDLQKEAFGATGAAVSGRGDNIALLNDLVGQTEARINAAAEAAKAATATTNDKLTELNASADDQVRLLTEAVARLGGIEQAFGLNITTGASLVQNFTRPG